MTPGGEDERALEQPPTPATKDGWHRLVTSLATNRLERRRGGTTTVTARDLCARVAYQISERYAYDLLRETADVRKTAKMDGGVLVFGKKVQETPEDIGSDGATAD